MSCELTLFSTLEIPVNNELLKSNIHEIIETVIKKVFESEDNFDFYKKKN